VAWIKTTWHWPEVYSKLNELRDEPAQDVRSSSTYTVADAIADWRSYSVSS
jgi:hypothetical protein